MKSVDLSYAAGVIDSDGCIFVYVARRNNKPGNREYRACVQCSQTTPQAVKFLHKLFGGAINITQPKHHTNLGMIPKPQMHWKVASIDARECIKAVMPYLKIKKAVALKALRFIAVKEATVVSGKARSAANRKRLDKLAKEVSNLNSAKGVKREA